jgi:tripartite ATP-independent transporter DctP family solute receptor
MKGKNSGLMFRAVLATALIAGFLLAGCSRTEERPRVLKFALTNAPDSFITSVVNEFAKIVNENAEANMEVQVFPASQLGDQRDYIEGLQMGSLEMALIAIGALEGFEPRFIMYSLPFLFESTEHFHRFYQSNVSQQLVDDFRNDQGIRHIGIVDSGHRWVWTPDIEIRNFADFQRLNVRVPSVPIYINMFRALGANPIPMPLGDVYTGAQTGVINAFEIEVDNFLTLRLDELLKVGNITNHTYNVAGILISERVFNSLTSAQQNIIIEAGHEATRRGRIAFERHVQSLIDSLESRGVAKLALAENVLDQIRGTLENVARDSLGTMYNYDELVSAIQALR